MEWLYMRKITTQKLIAVVYNKKEVKEEVKVNRAKRIPTEVLERVVRENSLRCKKNEDTNC